MFMLSWEVTSWPMDAMHRNLSAVQKNQRPCMLTMEIRSSHSWKFTQRGSQFTTDVSGQPIVPIFQDQAIFSKTTCILNTGPIGCPETSVAKYQSNVRHTPEEGGLPLYHGGSLKSSATAGVPLVTVQLSFSTVPTQTCVWAALACPVCCMQTV